MSHPLDTCSHAADEVCRCDEDMTCICPACCAKRWPEEEAT